MRIAAQKTKNDLSVFIEGTTWKKATTPLDSQIVSIDLVVYIIGAKRIFHDAWSRPEVDTDPSLLFCREELTLANFNKKVKKAGYGEPPYEIRLSSPMFDMKKEFVGAYFIHFTDYKNNPAFTEWLSSFPAPEADLLLQRVKNTKRYYSRDCTEFKEYDSLQQYIRDRFELWYDATVKDYEAYLAKENETK
jgi:hypothetical protein